MPELPKAPPRALASSVVALHRGLRRASEAVLPPFAAVFNVSIGPARGHLLHALVHHGVFDALDDGPATAAQIARRLGLHADTLHRVLRAAAVEGVVRLDRRGRFRLTRTGRALRSDDPSEMAAWVRYFMLPSTQTAWAGLTDTLRTGEPSFTAVHGRSVWDHFADHPEEGRTFAAAMRGLTRADLPVIVAGYPWPERGTVCDVAGGVGTLLAAVLRARPGLRGVLVDAPGVLAEAEGHLACEGVRDRVELRPGNMFEHVAAAADVYVLKDILHDWDDARCLQVLRTVRAAMPAGARVVLVENLQGRNEVEPFTSLADVQMLTQCDGGRQRSVAELHALLRGARLRPGELRRTAAPALVEGIAA